MFLSKGRSRSLLLTTLLVMMALPIGAVVPEAGAQEAPGGPNSEKPNPVHPKTVLWGTDLLSDQPISQRMERLYLSLYNTGKLPVKTIQIEKGRALTEDAIEAIMREQGLFYGDFFDKGIQSVLCDLNPDVCRRKRVKSQTLDDVTSHVGGFEKSYPYWPGIDTAETLVVPALEINKSLKFKRLPKPAGESLGTILDRHSFDCKPLFDAPCDAVVRDMNAWEPKALEAEIASKPMLPYYRLRADIPIASPPFPAQKGIYSRDTDQFSEVWNAYIASADTAFIGLQALKQDLLGLPRGGNIKMSAQLEPGYQDQKPLLEAISHPFAIHPELPPEMQANNPIVVLDNWIDDDHCELAGRVELMDSPTATGPEDQPKAPTCGDISPLPLTRFHHGTHVSGLMVSMLNQQSIVGLNPYGRVVFKHLNRDSFRDAAAAEAVMDTIAVGVLRKNVRVINMSWGYDVPRRNLGSEDGEEKTELTDDFVEFIKENLPRKLLVTSAGNDNRRVPFGGAGCPENPACEKAQNIISVVGLTTNHDHPEIWRRDSRQGSNHGTGFDIAAVAENVLSLAGHDYTGIANGTSMAAPQVSAAASLIHAAYEAGLEANLGKLEAGTLKNRLMYTADVFDHLIEDVYSGRLNVARAIDIKRDYLELRDGSAPLVGTLEDWEVPEIQCRVVGGKPQHIAFDRVRRMHKIKDEPFKYTVFYLERSGKNHSKLIRHSDCYILTQSNTTKINTNEFGPRGSVQFQLSDIKEYISRIR